MWELLLGGSFCSPVLKQGCLRERLSVFPSLCCALWLVLLLPHFQTGQLLSVTPISWTLPLSFDPLVGYSSGHCKGTNCSRKCEWTPPLRENLKVALLSYFWGGEDERDGGVGGSSPFTHCSFCAQLSKTWFECLLKTEGSVKQITGRLYRGCMW